MDPVRPNNRDMKEQIDSNQAELTNMISHNRSEQKHYCTYMCQTNRIKPSSDQERVFKGCCVRPSRELIEQVMEDEPKLVERTQGLCDNLDTTNTECLRETDLSTGYASTTTLENSEFSDEKTTDEGENPNLLHLTKMQWLTDSQTDSTDSRSSTPPISRSVSFAIPESSDSEGDMKGCVSFGEKCLSTILRLDREHNMFGLSNITIVDSKMLKKSRKDDKDPAFPQTTIIQLLCCEKKCCHKSNTDLPLSLKRVPCAKPRCLMDCNTRYGMKISLKRKPKFEPSPRGRPRNRWMDCVKDDMIKKGVTVEMTADRLIWRTET
ncbi:hypothetical protein RR48_14303 [Papilio machaon]|uniref:Uncharacterized protein n=1 Tax=Papilio machaon TaxID=76193 RepID=A0A194QMI6_PAPMA|nr:hypothetical protein RR48_14303 [Papilio machaon]